MLLLLLLFFLASIHEDNFWVEKVRLLQVVQVFGVKLHMTNILFQLFFKFFNNCLSSRKNHLFKTNVKSSKLV